MKKVAFALVATLLTSTIALAGSNDPLKTPETNSLASPYHDEQEDCKYDFDVGRIYEVKQEIGVISDEASMHDVCHFGLICFRKDNLYGWVHIKSGKIVIPAIYESKSTFKENNDHTAIVQLRKDGVTMYGAINTKGEYVLPLEKRKLTHFGNNLYLSTGEENSTVINSKSEVILDGFDLMVASNSPDYYIVLDNHDSGYMAGIVDSDGKLVVPKVFTFRKDDKKNLKIAEGIAAGKTEFSIKKSWRYYEIGKGWLNEEMYQSAYMFSEGKGNVKSGYKSGYVDTKGKEHWTYIDERKKARAEREEALENNFDSYTRNRNNKTVVKDGKYGLASKNGEILIPMEYDSLGIFSLSTPSIAVVKKDGKFGCISKENEIIIPISFDFIQLATLVLVAKNKKYGYFEYDGTMVAMPKYDKLGDFSSDYCVAGLDGKMGLMNKSGDLIVPCIYKTLDAEIQNERVAVTDFNNKAGYVNLQGEVVIPLKYASASYFYHGEAIVEEDGLLKIIDATGKITAEFTGSYEFIIPCKANEGFIFKEDGKFGIVSSVGEVMVPPIITSMTSNGDKTYNIRTIYGNGKLTHFAKPSGINLRNKEGNLIHISNDHNTTLYVFQRKSYQTSENDAELYTLKPGKSITLTYHANSFIFLSAQSAVSTAKVILSPKEQWQREMMRTEVILLSQWLHVVDINPRYFEGKLF